MVAACSIPIVFDLLAQFHDSYPAVDLTLAEDYSTELIADVLTGRLDLALVGIAGDLPDGLASHSLVDEALVAAVPRSHPLFGRSRLALKGLDGYPIITMPVGTGIRSAFDDACRLAEISPRIAFEASTSDAITQLAFRGLGVAILSESMVLEDENLHAIALTGPAPRSRLDFVWRADVSHSPASRTLIGMVTRALSRGA
jgi:DNA-binding transcriptional LysR family regulator